jgi:hypothetical protein
MASFMSASRRPPALIATVISSLSSVSMTGRPSNSVLHHALTYEEFWPANSGSDGKFQFCMNLTCQGRYPKKKARTVNDSCGAKCSELAKVL